MQLGDFHLEIFAKFKTAQNIIQYAKKIKDKFFDRLYNKRVILYL